MKVLVGCESSGIVRDAFIARGHDAVSCDLGPTERPGPHFEGDLRHVLSGGWDLLIAHPPCTYTASSGLHWNRRRPGRQVWTDRAVEFARMLIEYDAIPRRAVESSVGCLSTRIRKPDQIIQPYEFGEDASKATCLWLAGLPLLVPTEFVAPIDRGGPRPVWSNQTPSGQNKLGPSPTRAKDRSRTYQGIADAMADQWGGES